MTKEHKDLPSEYDQYEAGELVVGLTDLSQLRLYRILSCNPPVSAGKNSTLQVMDSDDNIQEFNANDVSNLDDFFTKYASNQPMVDFLKRHTADLEPLPKGQEYVKQRTIDFFKNGANRDYGSHNRRVTNVIIAPAASRYVCHPNKYLTFGATVEQLWAVFHQNTPNDSQQYPPINNPVPPVQE